METQKRILHIEDDTELRSYVSTLFEENATINRSDSIQDAKQRILNEKYDIIILDMTLPDGSGMEIINLLKSNNITIPIIILSGHDVIDNMPNVKRVFLKNRHNTEDLVELVEKLLN